MILFTIILMFLSFFYQDILIYSTIKSLNLYFTKIFPFLFIYFILVDLIIESKLSNIISNILYKPCKFLFNIKYKTSASIIFLSIISGFPSNAKLIKENLSREYIDYEEAIFLTKFCSFSNMLFLSSVISFSLSTNIKVFLIHIISNIIIGVFYSNSNNQTINNKITSKLLNKGNNTLDTINKSINKNQSILINILLIIIFYNIIGEFVNLLGNNVLITTIKSTLEFSTGIINIKNTQLSVFSKLLLINSILAFNGLSVHSQVKYLLNDKNLYKSYFHGRLFQVFIVIYLTMLLF